MESALSPTADSNEHTPHTHLWHYQTWKPFSLPFLRHSSQIHQFEYLAEIFFMTDSFHFPAAMTAVTSGYHLTH